MVALRNVRHFVSHYACELLLARHGFYETDIETDVTAGDGESIDCRVVDDEEGEGPAGTATGSVCQTLSERLSVFRDLGICDERKPCPNLAHELIAKLLFLDRRQCGVGGFSQNRQILLCRCR